ncbi:hypothetical protein ACFOWE_13480 [Planomonospora corallina]|uniref:Uncharacterized protein n=1 Tax=Planomonospora corallina TaxID=1806052 RepID=A0ABV8I5E6_9ACTN
MPFGSTVLAEGPPYCLKSGTVSGLESSRTRTSMRCRRRKISSVSAGSSARRK